MNQLTGSGKKLATDVVVVGAGFAGLSAALEAQQLDAEVIVLSRTGLLANNSAMSGGQVALIGTPLQKEMGIEDSPKLYAQDLMKANNNTVDAELINVAADGATELYEWLTGFGAQFHKLISWHGHSVPRVHQEIDLRGGGMVKLLYKAAKARSIDVRLGTAAISLLTSDSGGVVGVKARDRKTQVLEIQANRGVVLAAGGFAKNQEMLQKYIPKLAGRPVDSAGGSTGDGVSMGMEVGAGVVGMDTVVMGYSILSKSGRYMRHQAVPMSLQLAMGEGIAVNKEGRRFMDEIVSYARGTSMIMRQKDCICFVIFDEQTKSQAELVEYDEVFTGETAEELAAELSIDRRALAETIASYNEAVRNEAVPKVDGCGQPVQRHCLQGRLFAMPITAHIIMTHGGLKINTKAQVIHQRGHPIRGLYAAGDNAAGLGGLSDGYNACPGYLSGTGNLTAFCFGRIAGRNAARMR